MNQDDAFLDVRPERERERDAHETSRQITSDGR